MVEPMNRRKIILSLIILSIATGVVLWLYEYGGGRLYGSEYGDGSLHNTGATRSMNDDCEGMSEGENRNESDGRTDRKNENGRSRKIDKNYLKSKGGDNIQESEKTISEEYDEFKSLNDDLLGIVDIEGMDFNYPVMMSKTPNYYLNHDFFKKYSVFGCPYIGEGYSIINNNIVIYGHCINKDKMFGKLLSLKNKNVLDRVKRICLYSDGKIFEYEVVALLSINVDDTDYRYWEVKDFKDEKAFAGYVDGIVENGIYVSEEKLKYGNYLMLSTCDNELGGGYRIVLVGRMLENNI